MRRLPTMAQLAEIHRQQRLTEMLAADRNRKRYGKDSKQPGITFRWGDLSARPWRVRFSRGGRIIRVGSFCTEVEAIKATKSFLRRGPKVSVRVGSDHDTTNATGFRGVQIRGGRFAAELRHRRKQYSSVWNTAKNAALAYDVMARRLFGKRAICNFLPDGSRNPEALTKADLAKWLAERAEKAQNYLALNRR
jgi:hypothetical protein